MALIPTRYGTLHTIGQDADLIEGVLRRCGEWGWLETCFVASVLPDKARVLDGGAFLGTFGLGLAMLRPLTALLAVEANPAVLPCLMMNLRLARCPATAIGAMLAAPGSEARHGAAPAGNTSAASFMWGAVGDPVATPSHAVILAGLRTVNGPYDLIKLDLEGMEFEVLRADAANLSSGESALWIECNEDMRALDICALLLSWGLPVHYFAAPAHNPGNHAGNPVPAVPWAYEAGLLAAPRRPPELLPELRRAGCILQRIETVDDLTEALWRTPRWGMPDWPVDDPAALAALAGRTLRCQARDTFLQSAAPLGSRENEQMWQRMVAAEARATQAEALLATLGAAVPAPAPSAPAPAPAPSAASNPDPHRMPDHVPR